ncbi:cytochrome P450, partial [Gloeophyllum trabeum ATCC 11539]
HRCAEDDWYNGYFIPKGTICIPNVMGMNKDPAVWGPDAQQFNPQGHLDKDGRLAQAPVNTKEESHATFGFGPRTCPGRHLANNSLFFSIASILWASHIRPARDKGGKEIVPDPSQIITGGLVM